MKITIEAGGTGSVLRSDLKNAHRKVDGYFAEKITLDDVEIKGPEDVYILRELLVYLTPCFQKPKKS
jgi:hypothetical protein